MNSLLGRIQVAVLIIGLLLVGWLVFNDVKMLKADVTALKRFLVTFPPPKSCKPPGEHTPWKCYYELDITQVHKDEKGSPNRVFSGKVAKSLVDRDAVYCVTEAKKNNVDPGLCADPTKYVYREFTFHVDGDISNLDEKTTGARFVSDPITDHLTKTK